MWVSDFMTERNCATPQLVYGFAVYITYFFNYIPIPFFANFLQLSENVFIHIYCYLKITNCFA